MDFVVRCGRFCWRPFPLSCVLHACLLLPLAVFLGREAWQPQPGAGVVMELTWEEAAVSPAVIGRSGGLLESLQATVEPPQESTRTTGTENSQAATNGSAVVLAADEAVESGDGAVAAGSGHEAVASGGSANAGQGTDYGSTRGSEAAVSAVLSTAGSGSGTGGGATESAGDIAARFAARVEANKEYPYMAVRRGLTGVVTVSVTLGTDGSLQGVSLTGSSGESLLDESALEAVRNSCPFPHGVGRSISLQVPIYYQLN